MKIAGLRRVTVVGIGNMGHGLAQACATPGLEVVVMGAQITPADSRRAIGRA